MRREDFTTEQELADYILGLERDYTARIFHVLYSNAGNLQAWYNEANKVPEAWAGKMVISILRAVRDYRDVFRAGKDGRAGHRYRINLPALAAHESWRWREIRYEAQGFVVTR
jgi:hypothetical protein